MSRDWIDYLISQGAQLSDNGKQIHFPSSNESSAQVCVLSSQAIVEASGPDTLRFLQGQLTCNMAKLTPMQHTAGAVCTPKGRMYASFITVNTGSNYLFRMNKGVTDNFISGLGKYAVFYKSELSIPAEPYVCLGLTGANTEQALRSICQVLPEAGTLTKIDNGWLLKTAHLSNCYELWVPESEFPAIWEKATQHFTPASESIWQQQRIAAVLPEVTPESIEKYIPQHLNLPSLNYISFRKGCYTGQEIVARMQNLGQQKSRTCHITIERADEVPTSSRLINEQGKAIGDILEVTATTNNKHEALAVLRIDADNVSLESDPKCQVTVNPIPYTIDARAELQF